jgi:type I restriction enzyme S subunit
MQELLTNGIDKNGQIRTPQTHTYKQSELGLIPDEWEVDSIENHAKIITGDKDTQDRLDDGEYPFYVRSQTIERINTYSFDGEAVLTAGDGVGVGKVFHFVNEKFDFHQRVYCIHDFSEKLNSSFFFEYFRTYFIEQVNKYSAKGSVDSVRYDMIALMNIPLPTFEEQKQIAKILTTQDKKIEIEETNLDKLKELKKGLMNDLLSGVVRVKV